jgi:hypothetical protein
MKITVHQIVTLGGQSTEVFVATAQEITGLDTGNTTSIIEEKLRELGYATLQELSHIPLKPINRRGKEKYFLSGGTHPQNQWGNDSEWAFIKLA